MDELYLKTNIRWYYRNHENTNMAEEKLYQVIEIFGVFSDMSNVSFQAISTKIIATHQIEDSLLSAEREKENIS
ncbi:MAG: hypothetical protein ABW185_06750 [Sedimenticola sp.]